MESANEHVAPVKAYIRAVIDEDVEGLTILFVREPPAEERRALVREVVETLYNNCLVGPISHGMDVHIRDIRTESPARRGCPESR